MRFGKRRVNSSSSNYPLSLPAVFQRFLLGDGRLVGAVDDQVVERVGRHAFQERHHVREEILRGPAVIVELAVPLGDLI